MRPELLTEINQCLGQMGANPMVQTHARTDKFFELFVWSCTLRALRNIGAPLSPRNSNDQATFTLRFRLGPGLLYNPASAPGFVVVDYQGSKYELQNGLRVLGSSKVLHELDLCILKRSAAKRCRRQSIDPDCSAVKFLAECKYYGNNLPLHLGREYLGLSSEFSLRVKTLVANRASPEVHKLVKRHKGTTNFNINPNDTLGMDQFVGWLATELKHVL